MHMKNLTEIRAGRSCDAAAVAVLWTGSNVIRAREDEIRSSLNVFPSVVAQCVDDSFGLVGFAYSEQLAPEVLEVKNIMVAEQHRNRGIGSMMLQNLEMFAANNYYRSIIVFNSDLYKSREHSKLPATSFYLRAGYNLVDDTGNTRTFVKPIS